MCPSHNYQARAPADVQNMSRGPDLQEKLDILREEMIVMEKNRREEAKELEEKLLNEIRMLARAIREKKI